MIDGVRMTSTGGTGIGVGGTAPSRVNDINPEAVSYTHLRAHETVLDLVCRLLLEKKKYNKHNVAIGQQQKQHNQPHR